MNVFFTVERADYINKILFIKEDTSAYIVHKWQRVNLFLTGCQNKNIVLKDVCTSIQFNALLIPRCNIIGP
jgi:hypothetical protein